MKNIKAYIGQKLKNFKSNQNIITYNKKKINWEKEDLISDYNKWIRDLYISLNSAKSRFVLTEIETFKNKYEKIPEYHWKYKLIQIKAMLNIIQKKIKKYNRILSKGSNYQTHAILFWFNQIVLIFEKLNLEFRCDLNSNNKNMIQKNSNNYNLPLKPIQSMYKGYLELLYMLIKYSYIRNKFQDILAYLAIADSLAKYSSYIINIDAMPILQKIFLIKAKIYLANCDYLNAYKYIKIITDLCIGQLIYIVDHRSSLENIDTNDNNMTNIGDLSKNKIKTLQTVLMNVILNFYYRGVLSELLGCTAEAIDSYKQSKFFSSKFFKNKYFNFTMFFFHLQNNGYKYLAVMEEFKEYKEQDEIKKAILKRQIERKNFLKRMRYQKNYNKYYSRIRVNHNLYKGELKKFLDDVSLKSIKEEENRQGILAKFKKYKYITSTMNLINAYLSKNFTSHLKKMKTIEISKYSKEINDYMYDTYYKKENINDEDNNKSNRSNNDTINKEKKELKLNAHNTINNIKYRYKLQNLTSKNDKINVSNNKINYNLYNFSHNNINQKISIKNSMNNSINSDFKSLNFDKKSANDSSHSPSLFKKAINRSSIIALNSIENDLNFNNIKLPKSTKYNFYKKQSGSSLILNHLKYKINRSSINSKEISKNNCTIKKCFLKKRNDSMKKIFKIKIRSNNKEHKNSKSIDKSKEKNRDKSRDKSQDKNKSKDNSIDEYKIDQDYFDKSLIKKKNYLDKFCFEELKFHRQLLEAKSCEIEAYEDINDYDSKKSEQEAEIKFNRILELCKSSIGKKNFDKFFKNVKLFKESTEKGSEKIKFKKKNSQEYNSRNDTFDMNKIYSDNKWNENGNKFILKNNETKYKILNNKYEDLVNRENELSMKKIKV